MIASILRLFALRPLLSAAIFGIPVLILIALGLFTVALFKFAVFVVLPVAFFIWIWKSFQRQDDM